MLLEAAEPSLRVGEEQEVGWYLRLAVAARPDECLEDEQSCALPHGGAARAEDACGFPIGPVVKDVGEEVEIRAGGNGGEEVAADEAAPVFEFASRQVRARLMREPGPVEDGGSKLGMTLKDGRDQRAAAAADIDQGAISAEVVKSRDRLRFAGMVAGHGAAELRFVRQLPRRVVEARTTARGGAVATSNGLLEPAECLPDAGVSERINHFGGPRRGVGPEQRPALGEIEAIAIPLREEIMPREEMEKAAKRSFVRTALARQFAHRPGPAAEAVGQAERNGHVDGASEDMSAGRGKHLGAQSSRLAGHERFRPVGAHRIVGITRRT